MTLVIGIAMMAALAAADAPVQVEVTLDPPVVPYHRQSQYTITVDAPNSTPVQLPDMLEKFGGLPVSDVSRKTEKSARGRQRIIETYVLDPIRAASYCIYPAKVKYGEDQSITVPSPALTVRDLTEDEKKAAEEFADIADAVSPPTALQKDWKYIALGAIAAIAVITAAAVLVMRRKKKSAPAPTMPPWEVAYQRLRELDERHLPEEGKYEAYYVDLSAILRYYIEDRFHLHAPEQTTPEFLSAATGRGVFTQNQQQLLASFLRHCDYVKFAKYVPNVEEMEQSFATVLQFIDDTVPKPEPEDGKPEAAA